MYSASITSGVDIATGAWANRLRRDAYASSMLVCHQRVAGANNSVRVEDGFWYTSAGVKVTVAAQDITGITAPSGNPRIDLISCNTSGTIVRTVGTVAASPVAPALPAGNFQIAQIYMRNGATIINDTDSGSQGYIIDMRNYLQQEYSDKTTANNGLTKLALNIQLGQTLGAGGDPAALTTNMEIPLNTFRLRFKTSAGVGKNSAFQDDGVCMIGGNLEINTSSNSNTRSRAGLITIDSKNTSDTGGLQYILSSDADNLIGQGNTTMTERLIPRNSGGTTVSTDVIRKVSYDGSFVMTHYLNSTSGRYALGLGVGQLPLVELQNSTENVLVIDSATNLLRTTKTPFETEFVINARTPADGGALSNASFNSTVSGMDVYSVSTTTVIGSAPYTAPAGYSWYVAGTYRELATVANAINDLQIAINVACNVASVEQDTIPQLAAAAGYKNLAVPFMVAANNTGNSITIIRKVKVETGITPFLTGGSLTFSGIAGIARWVLRRTV